MADVEYSWTDTCDKSNTFFFLLGYIVYSIVLRKMSYKMYSIILCTDIMKWLEFLKKVCKDYWATHISPEYSQMS